ncbi:hypothetical protein UMM65_15940 [Aureibaculum sp. 2210JD6-5]|uniref:hypothetical protein n=1 Tax=Aureibaculum sp. 2210JD6-5 TaxID=3103957 RepID=UPI002AAEC318|nr:hypothetical protein [Aureibaculum sp. 2210JD6-5]MDY7396740.1 hypothetical protein [Aureibaculum sp. 2210JD6-5]
MEQINYIKQLSAVMEKFAKDKRLNPTHISMYLALFQYWNLGRFSNPFSICREEIMKLSKIGSKVTYHKCIKELHHWRYLEYHPSHNPFKGSSVIMFNFCTAPKQAMARTYKENGQALSPAYIENGQALIPYKTYINNKHIKLKRQPKNENEVIDFFSKKNWSALEAKKFYNHYQSIGWKVGGKSKIIDWQSTAQSWMLKADEIKTSLERSRKKEKTRVAPVQKLNNLNVNTDKNYGEPL